MITSRINDTNDWDLSSDYVTESFLIIGLGLFLHAFIWTRILILSKYIKKELKVI